MRYKEGEMLMLRELRTKAGLTQSELSKKIGISQNHYSWLELGKRKVSPKLAKRLAQINKIDWTEFFKD